MAGNKLDLGAVLEKLSGVHPVLTDAEPVIPDRVVLEARGYRDGARDMREKITQRLAWHAESAPNREVADFVWATIMDINRLQAPREALNP